MKHEFLNYSLGDQDSVKQSKVLIQDMRNLYLLVLKSHMYLLLMISIKSFHIVLFYPSKIINYKVFH